MLNATLIKVKDAQPVGEYVQTSVDANKASVDFRVVQVCPPFIRWNDGCGESVTKRQLAKLQREHTWAADF